MTPVARWIALAAGILLAAFLIWYFHTIVFYILISAVLAIIGGPMVQQIMWIRIGKWSMPRWLAATVALVIMGVCIALFAQAVVPLVASKLSTLSHYSIDDVVAILSEPIAKLQSYIKTMFPGSDISVNEMIKRQIESSIESRFIVDSLGMLTVFAVNFVVAVFSVAFITFFFLKEESLFTEWLAVFFPKKYEENVLRAMDSVSSLLKRYFVGICIETFIKLVCVSLAIYLIGVDFATAVIIGLVTSVFNVIPYIGPIIGGLIGCLIAVLSPVPGMSMGNLVLYVAVILIVFQLLDNLVLQPYIYSSSVKAHPLEIFIVILAAGYIAGIVGMLLAIPAYTALRVFAKEFFYNFRVVQRLTGNI